MTLAPAKRGQPHVKRLYPSCITQSRLTSKVLITGCIFLICLTFAYLSYYTLFSDHWHAKTHIRYPGLLPPADYHVPVAPIYSTFCDERFGITYLQKLRDRHVQYCDQGAHSSLACFHTQTWERNLADSFCLAQDVTFDTTTFLMDCPLRDISDAEIQQEVIPFEKIKDYLFDAGPREIFRDHFILLNTTWPVYNAPKPDRTPRTFTLLVKREHFNTWHSLLELLSMTLTFDALRMAHNPANGFPIFNYPDDASSTQVVFLDHEPDGPLFDLWTLFAGKQPLRLRDFADQTDGLLHLDNVIVPLPGGASTLAHNDWDVNDCAQATLVRVFANRVLGFHGLGGVGGQELDDEKEQKQSEIVVTFIDRKNSDRKLANQEKLLDAVREKFPRVQLSVVDLGEISFATQLRIMQDTDVLLGVHGAQLADSMFMRPGIGAVAEVLPEGVYSKRYRNLAVMVGNGYFSTHGTALEKQGSKGKEKLKDEKQQAEKHGEYVHIEQEKFVELVGEAIMSLYNKTGRNLDLN